MHWLFLIILLAAIVLMSLGSLSVWVVVLALLVKSLAAVVVVLGCAIVAYAVWKLYRKTRREGTPRLIFKR